MSIINFAIERQWFPRKDTPGWERSGLYNDLSHRDRNKKSYTTLNRVGPGGKVKEYSVEWEWELYVLEGELIIGDNTRLVKDDHAIIEAGEVFTCECPKGCIFLGIGHFK